MAWLSGYKYRQQITINATAAGAQTNYQMKLTVHKGAGASSGSDVYLNDHAESWTGTVPNDIRFTKADGKTPLDYWIESSDANTAIVWVEFDSIPASGSVNFYTYYGKAAVSSASNGGRAFQFFDDFEKDTLDVLFPAGRETHGAFWDKLNNKIYLLGGEDSASVPTNTIYSFNTDTYAIATEVEVLATAVGFISDAVVFDTSSRKAYIYGGKDSGTPTTTNKIQEYDVDANSVINMGITLPTGRGGVSAVLTSGGDVYIFGGLDYGTNLTVNTICKHDISEGTIETISETLPEPLAFMAAAYDSVNNKIYLYGGMKRNGGTNSRDEIYVFDVATETISTLTETLPQVRDSSTAVYYGGCAYIIGGMDTDLVVYYDTIIKHNPSTGVVSTENDKLEKNQDDFPAVFDGATGIGWLVGMQPNYAADNDASKARYMEKFTFKDGAIETTWVSKWCVDGGSPSIVGLELILSDASVRENIYSYSPLVFGTDRALRVRMREVTFAVSGMGGGVNPTEDFGGVEHYAEAYWYPDGVTGVVATYVAAPESTTGLSFPAGYAIFDIIRNGSTSVIFRRNDGVLATHTVQVPTDNFYIKLNCRAEGEIRYDWILVHKYASPEPTWGAWGSEEEAAVEEKKHTFRLDPKPRTRMSFHPNLKLG